MASRPARTVSHRTVRRLVRGWIALALVALAVLAMIAAQGTWRAIAAQRRAVPSPVASATPPIAIRTPAVVPAPEVPAAPAPAPAPGVTGTTALPPLPPAAALPEATETGVTPARPFALPRAGVDRGRALQCLADAIYYEAASEPDAGQQAVAQVILNRVRHPAFPATVCGVVYQGSERAGCQFSFACDGAMARVPSRAGMARALRTAAAALAGYVYAPVGLATHYHTYAVTPAWNRSLVMTDMVGAHLFHRWKGWWGTAPAFRQVYAGGEPIPGPHTPTATLAAITTPPPPPPMAVTEAASMKPDFADTGKPKAAPPVEDRLPDSGQVLDRWKDSGQPIR